ncbi:DUF7847 domain-containing protein [Natrarchaeobius oligotrophus]|uniref:DUF7847 domain-containing protein n=1 Tax=Natrarchaeobius chitinivorans TaxID=1679083 RepID=A0A3N6MSG5_NATCH|nr:hypothetical protein [Natrarchaeobius chitinivorans]RQH00761.1 hypothetical protein EA472_08970 [Natrarchaeobius chitinivorans]
MAVLPAFKDGVTVLREHPVILLAGLLFALVGQVTSAGEVVDSWIVSALGVVVAFLIGPFFLGGLIGMALEALEGSKPTLGLFVESGTRFYVSLLGATVLLTGLFFVLVFVGTLVGVVSVFAGFAATGAESGAAGLLGVGIGLLVFLGVFLVAFVAFLFLQFFNTAIVVDGERAIDSFSRSVSLVRANLRSVIGYSLLWIAVWTVAFAPIIGLELVLVEPGLADGVQFDRTVAQAVTIGLAVLVTGIGYAYLYAVHTSYYTRLGSADGGADGARSANA